MNYLSEMLKLPVLDVNGNKLGVVNDLGIATGEVFPHVTSLAFQGPGKTPFMISWRKYVDHVDESGVYLKACDTDVRFSFLQPDELLLARDILNKQIVDTQGLKVVRVNDLKLSSSGENQLRLLGAEVGMRGRLRAVHPALEHVAARIARPVKELKGFARVQLAAGEEKEVALCLTPDSLRFHDGRQWVLEPGRFEVMVGFSSRDEDLEKLEFTLA